MNNVKYFIGPMTKNVVDAILEFSEETENVIGFIPSRRQVEYDGGYVNNWTTKEFSEYVNGRLPIKRDHSGPGQGYTDDDGFGDTIIDVSLNNGRSDAFVTSSKNDEFKEYQFSVDDLESFTGFKIKIVSSGTDEANSTRFKDLRVIALA